MKRILFVQPTLSPPGGGNGLAAWMMEALKHEYRMSMLAWAPADLDSVNRFFGTDLHPSDFELHLIEPWIARLAAMSPTPMGLLKDHYLSLRCRRIIDGFTAAIGANNEADLGPCGIQYVHFPRFLKDRPDIDLRWWHHAIAPAIRMYYWLSERLTAFSAARMRRNLTLVNSDFTGRRYRAVHGIEAVTLYPPAVGPFRDVPWEEREDGFVCIGRFSGEKRIELMINILSAVRQAGPRVHLHVVGSRDWDLAYFERIRAMARANASWVSIHENLPRPELLDLIATHRFGIHGMHEEPFGMAVADLISSGCITFAPNSGGPVEILADERLVYSSLEDAVSKIVRAIRDPEYQASLRSHVETRKNLFRSEKFVTRLRSLVGDFLRERGLAEDSHVNA